ncbi:unnamed protein product [Gongylonema pulchrum]|uniref:TROVE domain-containing protein n=1 Tax=Gongylonema pulchrum TaxID=637853 RepID=A0A183DH38_9BILA|nr:unnamed protein product [Gongylonema pulchrum]
MREHIPMALINSKPVWAALLAKMPMMALLKNMCKLAAVGILVEADENRYVRTGTQPGVEFFSVSWEAGRSIRIHHQKRLKAFLKSLSSLLLSDFPRT